MMAQWSDINSKIREKILHILVQYARPLLLVSVFLFVGLAGIILWNAQQGQKRILAQNEFYNFEKKHSEITKEKLSVSVNELLDLIKKYPKMSYDGYAKVASWYFEFEQYSEALNYFDLAFKNADWELQKGFTALSKAICLENLKEYEKAISDYEIAYQFYSSLMKPQALLGIARCYEALKNTQKAKNSYEEILKQFYNTPYAKMAEMYLSRL